MRNAFAPIALAASLLLSSAAFADPMAASGTGTAATTPNAGKNANHAKRANCKAEWNAQTTHTGAKKDFMRACVGKG